MKEKDDHLRSTVGICPECGNLAPCPGYLLSIGITVRNGVCLECGAAVLDGEHIDDRECSLK